jgi:hypothetical protein
MVALSRAAIRSRNMMNACAAPPEYRHPLLTPWPCPPGPLPLPTPPHPQGGLQGSRRQVPTFGTRALPSASLRLNVKDAIGVASGLQLNEHPTLEKCPVGP